jgi:putative addiction module component (TIGR02574 family)
MTHEAQELLDRALKLSREARADLASRLLESLDAEGGADSAAVERAWRDEIIRRVRRVLDTGEPGIPFEQVAAEVREHLARKRARSHP